jgi:hypothetical protein
MARKIEKSIPWVTMFVLFGMVIFGGCLVLKEVLADTNYGVPSVTVGNAAPTVGEIILNSGSAITVTESSYVNVSCNATFTDTNGYTDLKWATATLRNNATTCGASNEAPAWCYYGSTTNGRCATSSCTGNTCAFSCTWPVWFNAVPASTSASSTPYQNNVWQCDIRATDQNSGSSTATTGQPLNILTAVTFTSSWTYLCSGGACAINQTSSQATTTATNTGNYHARISLYGVDMASNTSNASITVTAQKWATATTMGDWATGEVLQTIASTSRQWIGRSGATTTPTEGMNFYWQIKIPNGSLPSVYYGTNTIEGNWTD